ncbi:glycoside hydrolase family 114 protein [Amniculicola lignicola CBS 123094]|uniref:Glycoside hydrolase family 114 protein n=1 Tax=Amniculicola lignicola CBS 123094 TaxID=1392246 RepID=A0A6A5WFK9_9PLEO|nr:glycoside hydrolase family 114 protein [Amniculicola lignicola CBS 123094]
MISKMVDVVDFAVNEQCHGYAECAAYKPFTQKNKAVFNIEYGNGGDACVSPAGVKLSTLVKSEDQSLDKLGGACPGQVDEPAKSSAKPTSTAKGVVSTPSPKPTKISSVKPSSTKNVPTSTKVASVAPKPYSTKVGSIKPSGSKPTSTKASPTKATPTKAPPANATPTKASPTKATPTKAPPANATPTKAIPSNATPVKPSSTKPCTTSTKSSHPTGLRHPHWSKPWWTKSN